MTTWINHDITWKKTDTLGRLTCLHYKIAAINGDTGGTITVPLKRIDGFEVHGTKPLPTTIVDIVAYTTGKTIVTTHTDTGVGGGVIQMTVWGLKG